MADESLRYDKDNILAIPDLSIERHYESEGVIPTGEVPYEEPEKPDRYIETLDDLDRVYRLADLLPSDLGTIIKNITEVLSLDTQGKIILQFQEKPPEGSQPTPEPTPKPTEPEPTTTTPEEQEPAQPKEVDVVDIFSREPAFTIEIERGRSLVDISRAAYKQDDSDIKEHYTSMMTQITNRFFQIMTTLAEEANMEDYTFLLQDFDGTAVTTNDPNQRHLIDTICKGQIIYDQKLRQMNLTHTAANTLCMTRGFHAAEMQRERYLQEQYKTDMPDMTSSFSNDLLEASRSEATKKYKQAAYNQYKYLDNAVKDTNSLLNIKIDEASAKAQLSNTGSDIFAFTPPPPPTENHIDDNYEATQASQKSAQDAINNSQKDAVTGAQAAAGGGTSAPGSGSSSGGGGSSPVGRAPGVGADKIPVNDWTKDMAVRCSQKCGIPADWLWAQWKLESNFDVSDGNYNCGGVTVPNSMEHNSAGFGVWHTADDFADYFADYILRYSGTGTAKTLLEYVNAVQAEGYCTEPPGQEYVNRVMSILGDTTVLSN